MSSLTIKVSSEKALQLQLTCESHHKRLSRSLKHLLMHFQGQSLIYVLLNSLKRFAQI